MGMRPSGYSHAFIRTARQGPSWSLNHPTEKEMRIGAISTTIMKEIRQEKEKETKEKI